MSSIENLYKQGQIDFIMKLIDYKYTYNVSKEAICHILNISVNEFDSLLKYYTQWKEAEKYKECGKADMIKTIVTRHDFLSVQEKANLLNITVQQLNYYLSYHL